MPIVPTEVTIIPVFLNIEPTPLSKVSTGLYLHPSTGEVIRIYEMTRRGKYQVNIKYRTVNSRKNQEASWVSTGPQNLASLRFNKVILP